MQKVEIEIKEIANECFVIMPFRDLFDIEYSQVIKPAIESVGLKCIRGDEIYSDQMIMADLWNSIRKCRVVIAELTGRNPNVLYEVGLAHALGKPIIIITRNKDDVPFDLRSLRYFYYDINNPSWGNNLNSTLIEALKNVIENPEIGKYLDGVRIIGENVLEQPSEKQPENINVLDISGRWVGEYKNPHRTDVTESITLTISQNNNRLEALGITQYSLRGMLTVVNQTFIGEIQDDKITLRGVNYTFLQRGNESGFGLDNLDLQTKDDKLIGFQSDHTTVDEGEPIELKRYKNDS